MELGTLIAASNHHYSDATSGADMARSSILGAERAATQASGRDSGALGPSDSSDSGSDVQGTLDLPDLNDVRDEFGGVLSGPNADSDSAGTGERGSALPEERVREGSDIAPDRIRDLSEEVVHEDSAEDLTLEEIGGSDAADLLDAEGDEAADDSDIERA